MPSFALWEIMSQRDGMTGTPAGRGLDGLAVHAAAPLRLGQPSSQVYYAFDRSKV